MSSHHADRQHTLSATLAHRSPRDEGHLDRRRGRDVSFGSFRELPVDRIDVGVRRARGARRVSPRAGGRAPPARDR